MVFDGGGRVGGWLGVEESRPKVDVGRDKGSRGVYIVTIG